MNILRFIYTIFNPRIIFRGKDDLLYKKDKFKYHVNVEHLYNDKIIIDANSLYTKDNNPKNEINTELRKRIINDIRTELIRMLYEVEVVW